MVKFQNEIPNSSENEYAADSHWHEWILETWGQMKNEVRRIYADWYYFIKFQNSKKLIIYCLRMYAKTG